MNIKQNVIKFREELDMWCWGGGGLKKVFMVHMKSSSAEFPIQRHNLLLNCHSVMYHWRN